MMKRMKRIPAAVIAAFWLLMPLSGFAQVHIGDAANPVPGTLLDLSNSSQLGLLPLNVSIEEIDQIPEAFTDHAGVNLADLEGLIVYNNNELLPGGKGLYVWDGVKWAKVERECPLPTIASPVADTTLTSYGETTRRLAVTVDGDGLSYQWESSTTGAIDSWTLIGEATDAAYDAPATTAGTVYYHCIVSTECGNITSPAYTVNVLESIPTNASYTVTGATCYDVAQSGTLTGRTNAFASTHTMTYTFNYGNSFTNLSFAVLSDPSGIISGISSPTATEGTGSSTQNFSVTFSSSIESIVYGSTATARIAASYTDNTGTQKIAYIDVVAKDLTCCAYVLGADGRCYRRGSSSNTGNTKPKCPTGWSYVSNTIVEAQVLPAAWTKKYARQWTYKDNKNGSYVTFGTDGGTSWTSSAAGSLVSSALACVQ
ncbi:MAG: hypothetical protein LBO74_15325 [Candidatus Symbiothrix sp.]|nr:hypothetical protein [Candidatus Symbiothrix sp.]